MNRYPAFSGFALTATGALPPGTGAAADMVIELDIF